MKRIMQYCMACIVLAGTLSSCSRQEEPQYAPDGGEVLFQGLVKNSNMVSRSSDFNEKDFVLINSSTDAQFGDIRICSSTFGAADVIAEYEPADAWQGRLSALNTPLKWSKGTDAEYTFYACTYPSGPEGSDGGVTMDANNPMQGTVTFGTQKDTHLESFIVAKEGPLKYADNGSYVKLLFYRPVAKIQIESVTHFDAAGSQTPIKQCKIDFPNLYRTASFYAKKVRTDDNPGDVWLQPGEDPQLDLSWEWDVSAAGAKASDYVLYVHPFSFGKDEADGGQPDPTQPGYFRITATIDGAEKVYFASLAGLKNIRELKAGQFMKMQIAVQDGGGGGLGCRIVDWNTEDEQTVSHRRAGIYTQEDADNLLKILQASPLDTDALDNYCRDGKNIYLYTSVDWSSVKGPLKIPDGYTLCKQGYSVTLGAGGQLE
ncbi:fimbrillin family protein [Phocaeicola plebeius]|uniref:fimbrillin family protein n=1 Tax=Phocaeicola plebeius TaxID=310297 RepID=UPI0026ED7267|nr:fimbrillin family protein [Phocaeicola plebeius]